MHVHARVIHDISRSNVRESQSMYVLIYIFCVFICHIFLKKTKTKQNNFFTEFFFTNINSVIIWNRFKIKIILLAKKHLFCGYSKWRQIKSSVPGLNRGLSSKFGD